MKFCYNIILPFLNNAKDLDPSYKTDLELLDCFGRKKLCLITEEIQYGFSLLLQSNNLDPSHKMDLEFLDCFRRGNPISYR